MYSHQSNYPLKKTKQIFQSKVMNFDKTKKHFHFQDNIDSNQNMKENNAINLDNDTNDGIIQSNPLDSEELSLSEVFSQASLLSQQNNVRNNLNFFPNPQSVLREKNDYYCGNEQTPNYRPSCESSLEYSDDCINKSEILGKISSVVRIEPTTFCSCNKNKKAEYMFAGKQKDLYCASCALEQVFKDKEIENILNNDELKRKGDICKFMEKVNDININLPSVIDGLNQKITEISSWYQNQLEKLNCDFSTLQRGLEEEHSNFITNLRAQYNEKQAYISEHVKHLNKYQQDIKQFTADISKNFVNIVKNMELEPFYEILSNYYNQIGEIQKSIDYLKEDMIKLVKVKTDKASLEKYRKEYRNLYKNKQIFLSLCDLNKYRSEAENNQQISRKNKYSFQQTSVTNKPSSMITSTNQIEKRKIIADIKNIAEGKPGSRQNLDKNTFDYMFDDELKNEAQKLIQTIDSFVGLDNKLPSKKQNDQSSDTNSGMNARQEIENIDDSENACEPREINLDYFEKQGFPPQPWQAQAVHNKKGNIDPKIVENQKKNFPDSSPKRIIKKQIKKSDEPKVDNNIKNLKPQPQKPLPVNNQRGSSVYTSILTSQRKFNNPGNVNEKSKIQQKTLFPQNKTTTSGPNPDTIKKIQFLAKIPNQNNTSEKRATTAAAAYQLAGKFNNQEFQRNKFFTI